MATKKDRRSRQEKTSLSLKRIEPLTENQKIAFDSYYQGKNLLLHGIAGTGKSFISIYLALNELMNNSYNEYDKLVIIRSVVPTRDMGFLPGSAKEKSKMYEAPYYAICTELFGRGDSYELLKNKELIEFQTTSFIRGITFNNSIIIVDEMANCTLHELDSVITRIGKNCKIMFCGDFRQSDFVKDNDKKGLMDFLRIIRKMDSFEFIDFDENDIVRSNLVKSYIIEKDRLGIVS
jgi:phosphate starvation-inducible PhoH-like protein/PhoH-like ATPase